MRWKFLAERILNVYFRKKYLIDFYFALCFWALQRYAQIKFSRKEKNIFFLSFHRFTVSPSLRAFFLLSSVCCFKKDFSNYIQEKLDLNRRRFQSAGTRSISSTLTFRLSLSPSLSLHFPLSCTSNRPNFLFSFYRPSILLLLCNAVS